MNTPTISAVLPVASGNAGHTQNGSGAEPENSPPFSDVLTRQRSTEPSQATPASANSQNAATNTQGAAGQNGQAAANSKDVAGQNGQAAANAEGATNTKGQATTGKTDASKGAPATEGADAAALAQAAAEQGLTLPQIALTIAAEVAAVQQSTHKAAGTQPATATVLGHQALQSPVLTGQGREPAGKPTLSELAASNAAATAARATAQPVQDLAAKAAPLFNTVQIGQATAGPAAHQTQLSANKAASLAGARQAVLAMQARTQASAGDDRLKPAIPDFSAAMASVAGKTGFDSSVFASNADLGAAQIGSIAASHSAAGASLLAGGSLPSSIGTAQANLPTIATPLQSPQWASEFGRQFVSLTQGGHNMPHTAELRLDPPELGPLRISINLSDNVAHAVFVSPHAAVRQTVENALPQLQQLLAQAGISLGQTSVSDQGQSQQAFNESSGNGQRNSSGNAAGGSEVAGGVLQTATRSRAPDALVDTFA